VVVTGELLKWETVVGVGGDFSGFSITTFKLPDHDTLVTGTSDEDIRGFSFFGWDTWGNGGDPTVVTLEDTLENEFSL